MTDWFTGIHHLKIPVRDLTASAEWYARAFGARRIERFDHVDETGRLYAVMLELPGVSAPVELRLAPLAADALRGTDPVTFGVADAAALARLVAHLDAEGVAHSPVVTGYIGQVIAVETPDGLQIRVYTDPEGGFEAVEFHPELADIHNPALATGVMGG